MTTHPWPRLDFEAAKDTYHSLHLWSQIVGKIKVQHLPWINHSWHVTLTVTPTGLTSGYIPAEGKYFKIDFDLLQHKLLISSSADEHYAFDLASLSVASCYHSILDTLETCGIPCEIHPLPNELEDVVPFYENDHAVYEPQHASDLHRALLDVHHVFTEFRAEFIGKCSPVHFFWGSFDLAVSRFSGRTAPLHPGGIPNLPDWVAQEAYSHEVSSCGFWPGNDAVPYAAFYSYIYPEPEGFDTADIQPEASEYNTDLGEYVLPYEAVRTADDPAATLLAFLRSTYRAAAELADWDRDALERSEESYLPQE